MHFLDGDAILLFDPVHQVVGFGKEELGVDGEEPEIFVDTRRHIDQHHAFGTERRRNGYAVAEGLERPGQSSLWSPTLRCNLYICDLVLDLDLKMFHARGSSLTAKAVKE